MFVQLALPESAASTVSHTLFHMNITMLAFNSVKTMYLFIYLSSVSLTAKQTIFLSRRYAVIIC